MSHQCLTLVDLNELALPLIGTIAVIVRTKHAHLLLRLEHGVWWELDCALDWVCLTFRSR